MNVNKYVNKLHRELDIVLDEMIIQDLERVGNAYFKKYQPMIDEVNAIVEECYSYNVMSEERYDKIINRFVDICVSVNGEDRIKEISDMLHTVISDNYDKYCEAIFDLLVTPLLQVAKLGHITKERCILEDRRAENRLNKRRKRFVDMYINEIDQEFVSVIFFARDALIDFGKAGRVIWNDEVEQVEVKETLDEVYGVVKTDDIKVIIDFALENGFKKVRQTGSHAIYRHSNGNMVVIPMHNTIDVYLGMAIQKQILERKD